MLLQRVRQFVGQHALVQPDSRVVAAVSGGSDSVALTHLLRELEASGDLRLAGIAHFNHQLRDRADHEEAFVAALAQRLTIPFLAGRGDVRARARRDRRSLESAARDARYEFFESARRHFRADVVALGHTRNDQAETFLLRLLRGAGPRGLAAMHPRNGAIVRPLLDCGRTELRSFLDRRRIEYVEDETNADVSIARNRVRSELLPLLADRFNPAIVEVLAREAELAREIWSWLESAEGEPHGLRIPASRRGALELDVAHLQQMPPPLRRLVLWRAMNEAAGGKPVSFSHVDAAVRLLSVAKGRADAPGHRVERRGSRLVLTDRPADHPTGGFHYPLTIPGEIQLREAGCAVSAELALRPRTLLAAERSGRGPLAVVRMDVCSGPLAVRNRRPGDLFRPPGLGGRKKLQDYFVDRKIDVAVRDRVPIVVDGTDRIVWVAGYGIDEAFRVTAASQSVLLLRLRQV
jgi:tRNA(Ile)-lysidine synthase